MRIYGVHSGRNNIARYLARSYCRNSSRKNYSNNTNTTKTTDTTGSLAAFLLYVFIIIVVCLILSAIK